MDKQTMLAKQLELSQQTFSTLTEKGLTDETKVELDFTYKCPGQESAEKLVALLKQETDYDVEMAANDEKTEWIVRGKPKETNLTWDIVSIWVEWMIDAGIQCECEFDGWGTSV